MRFGSLLLASTLALATVPGWAFAEDPAAPATTVQDPDAIICKSTPPPTGSRLGGGRECHSARDWDQREKDARKELEDKQMHGLQSCLGSCGG